MRHGQMVSQIEVFSYFSTVISFKAPKFWFCSLERFLRETSSGFESVRLLAQQTENSTSEWGSFWERSPLDSWFSLSAIWNVPGTNAESVRICGFKKNLSNLDRAHKMRDSVLLKIWDSFLVTLPSITSGTIKFLLLTFTALFFLKKWICFYKYTNHLQKKHHSENTKMRVELGEYWVLFRNGSVPMWMSTPELMIGKEYVFLT